MHSRDRQLESIRLLDHSLFQINFLHTTIIREEREGAGAESGSSDARPHAVRRKGRKSINVGIPILTKGGAGTFSALLCKSRQQEYHVHGFG